MSRSNDEPELELYASESSIPWPFVSTTTAILSGPLLSATDADMDIVIPE